MISSDVIFGTREHINAWQECARALVVFPYGLLVVRLVGARIFGRWSALDFIVSIIVGSALGRVLTGSGPVGATLAAVTLLMALHWGLARLAARYRPFSRIVEGTPVVLASGGRLVEGRMTENNITKADLAEALREKGVDDVSQTRTIVLEPSGSINVVK